MKNSVTRIARILFVGACLLAWNGISQAQGQSAPDSQTERSGSQTSRDAQTREGSSSDHSTVISGGHSRLTTSVSLPNGIQPKNNPAATEAIRDVFRTLVNAAAGGELNKMTEQFSAPDRNRIESYAKKVPEDFLAVVKGFGNLWTTRFGSAFNIVDRNVFGPQFLVVSTGEISDPAALTNWPLDPTPMANVPKGQGERSGILGRDYLAKGRDVAVVVLPATGDLPELTVSMTHEAPDFWKIDIPDNIDGPALKANLEQHINVMTSGQGQWSPKGEEGYRMAAHHILMAVYGIPPQGGSTTR